MDPEFKEAYKATLDKDLESHFDRKMDQLEVDKTYHVFSSSSC